MHYTDDQLLGLLEDVDSVSSSPTPMVPMAHLEECEACRSRLARLSGEGGWLDELLESVGDVTREHPPGTYEHSGASSIVICVDTSDAMSQQLQCESVRLDFLSPPTHPELLGRLGRYDIERLLGMGGYGIVFRARDSELNRVVAIKVLAPHLMHSGPARQRFAREAQASAAVVHDHVVPIYDVVAEGGLCYFVMQYIAGESLQERVDRLGPLPVDDVLRIGAQIAAGLHAAHQQGLIHRDVKPGNVLLEDTVNRVMISDFGLARASDDASLTRSGTITGTPHYMSPEQAQGQPIDHRSDLFSLGSVLYFMCTGHSPFRAPQMMAVLNRICHEVYRPIEEINSHVPFELTRIVDRLLSKSPEARCESADEVRQQLQRLLSDYQLGKLRPGRRPKWISSRKTWAVTLTGLVATVLMVLVVRTLPWLSGPESQPVRRGEARATSVIVTNETSDARRMNLPAGGLASSESWSAEVANVGEFQANVLMNQQLHRDMEDAASAIASLEAAATQMSVPHPSDAVWDHEVSQLNSWLQRMEDELEIRAVSPPAGFGIQHSQRP